jgi:3-oxoacyl-[acyl-carrier protein] reductase
MGLLEDRVAVITGAGRGIGRACALTFVREGAKVVINDVEEAPALEAKAACEAVAQGSAAIHVGSVANPADTDALMKVAADTFGKLDILVNNAGITRDRMSHQMTDEWWDLVIDVNLTGTFNCIRSAARYLRDAAKKEIEDHGKPRYHRKIVNFFSTAAIRGNPGQINYTAAKMGNIGITRTVAQEWGRFWVNVNAVAPGSPTPASPRPSRRATSSASPKSSARPCCSGSRWAALASRRTSPTRCCSSPRRCRTS